LLHAICAVHYTLELTKVTSTVKRPEAILLAAFPIIALGLVNGLYMHDLARADVAWYWSADLFQFVVLPTIGVFVLHLFGGYRPHDYGFRRFLSSKGAPSIAGLVVLVTFVFWLAYDPVKDIAWRYFGATALDSAFAAALPDHGPLRVVTVFYICLSAALVEETVFRSLPWLYFSTTMASPVAPYVVATTVLFSAIHWEHGLPNLIATATLGLASSLLYLKILNVWPFVAAHFLTGAWTYQWL
jgi:hypothetical protein